MPAGSSFARILTWRDQTQNNAEWQLTSDDDILKDRFSRERIQGPGVPEMDKIDGGSLEMFLKQEIDTFFAQDADKNLFWTVLKKDGIALSSNSCKLSSCFCCSPFFSGSEMRGRHSLFSGSHARWVVHGGHGRERKIHFHGHELGRSPEFQAPPEARCTRSGHCCECMGLLGCVGVLACVGDSSSCQETYTAKAGKFVARELFTWPDAEAAAEIEAAVKSVQKDPEQLPMPSEPEPAVTRKCALDVGLPTDSE